MTLYLRHTGEVVHSMWIRGSYRLDVQLPKGNYEVVARSTHLCNPLWCKWDGGQIIIPVTVERNGQRPYFSPNIKFGSLTYGGMNWSVIEGGSYYTYLCGSRLMIREHLRYSKERHRHVWHWVIDFLGHTLMLQADSLRRTMPRALLWAKALLRELYLKSTLIQVDTSSLSTLDLPLYIHEGVDKTLPIPQALVLNDGPQEDDEGDD